MREGEGRRHKLLPLNGAHARSSRSRPARSARGRTLAAADVTATGTAKAADSPCPSTVAAPRSEDAAAAAAKDAPDAACDSASSESAAVLDERASREPTDGRIATFCERKGALAYLPRATYAHTLNRACAAASLKLVAARGSHRKAAYLACHGPDRGFPREEEGKRSYTHVTVKS